MTARESFVCKNCGEKIHFYEKHGSRRKIWLHGRTQSDDCGMRAEPKPVVKKQRCGYPENGGGGHVEYCMMVLKPDGTCPEHGPRRPW